MNCKYCGKECKNENSHHNHERCCASNPDQTYREKLLFRLKSINHGKGHKSWNKGLTKETNEILMQASIKKLGKPNNAKWTEEKRKKQSELIKKAGTGGLKPKAGRGKKGYYKGIWCDSTWELAFVIWNIDNNINIQRSNKRLEYFFEGEKHFYYPDFIVNNSKIVEIKNYMNEKAKAKYSTYPEIEIITLGKIEKYIEYAKNKANSKDITILYDVINK